MSSVRSEAISAFSDISLSDKLDELGLMPVARLVTTEAGDDLGDPPLDPAALGLELERLRVAVGECRVHAIEERLRRSRRLGVARSSRMSSISMSTCTSSAERDAA